MNAGDYFVFLFDIIFILNSLRTSYFPPALIVLSTIIDQFQVQCVYLHSACMFNTDNGDRTMQIYNIYVFYQTQLTSCIHVLTLYVLSTLYLQYNCTILNKYYLYYNISSSSNSTLNIPPSEQSRKKRKFNSIFAINYTVELCTLQAPCVFQTISRWSAG